MEISPEKRARMLALLAMAWDGQWFLEVCEEYGWETATRLNAQVRAAFGRIEMRAMLRALGQRAAADLADAAQIINTYFREALAAGFDAQFTSRESESRSLSRAAPRSLVQSGRGWSGTIRLVLLARSYGLSTSRRCCPVHRSGWR